MRFPSWSYKPKQRKRTVVLTPKGWVVKETGELLVSNVHLSKTIRYYFNLDNDVGIDNDSVDFSYKGSQIELKFDDLQKFLLDPNSFLAALSKLRVATQYNPINIAFDAPGQRGYALRTPHKVGSGDLSSVTVDWSNWALTAGSTGELVDNTNGFQVLSACIEYNGITKPLKMAGQASFAIAAGDSNKVCDEILATAFGVQTIPLDADIFVKAELLLPATTSKMPFSDRKIGANAQAQVLVYDPAVTDLSDTSVPGKFTWTGTTPDAGRVSGYSPYVIGRHVNTSAVTVMARGDSIAAGLGDNVFAGQTPTGPGYFQRALRNLANKPASLNFAVSGSITQAGTADNRLAAYYSYCSHGYVDYGTNNVQFGNSPASVKGYLDLLIGQMTAKGINKIIVGLLTYKTTSTDNWATETNQTIDSVFASGGARDQLNSIIVSGYTSTLDFPSVKGTTNNHAWLANTTADGLHPNLLGNQLMANDATPKFQQVFS